MTIQQALQIAVKHHQEGRLSEAEGIYRQVLAVQPGHPDSLRLLGLIASQTGRHEAAVDLIRGAIEAAPGASEWHLDLGNALFAQGLFDEAIAAYRVPLKIKPELAMAHSNIGAALKAKGCLDESIEAYRKAIELAPDNPDSHSNLAVALQEKGLFEEAARACRCAIAIQPAHRTAWYNLGLALQKRGDLAGAIGSYRRATEVSPANMQAFNNLGNALRDSGQYTEAITAYRNALQVTPDVPELYNNIGNALLECGRFDDAAEACRQAVKLRPDYPEARGNLGAALAGMGQADEAIAEFQQAIGAKNEYPWIHSNLIHTLHFHSGHAKRLIPEERQRWNLRFSDPVKPLILPHANDRDPNRRLRIGYVSSDFRDHVVGRNLIPLFEHHDHESFEIFCYSGVAQPDEWTEKFRQRTDHWRTTTGVSDEVLAEIIRQDGMDVLVDLAQHLEGNRLPMFARKPAPVQVSFAGYPESTGVEAIEYRISDRFLEGSVADHGTGREHLELIDTFWCYDPCGMNLEVNALPARESGVITFGNLNNFCKVNDSIVSLWAKVLNEVKGSRLILLCIEGSPRKRTLEVLKGEGVDAHRVKFAAPRPRRDYLELYHGLDIVLDTFPYNGHTTSLDALWMGVPVVSLTGDTPVSRAGLSQLTNLGLSEWVAQSETEYVSAAVKLAGDLPKLSEFRSTLRPRMEASVLMDAPHFTQQIEKAYRRMWQTWCS